jgi:hypothetical protein
VTCGLREDRQLVTRFLANTDTSLAAYGYEPLQTFIVPFASHQNVVKAPPAGLERLLNRMQPVENFHIG